MQDRILSGRYRLIEQLGQGGMGSVWRAYDATLHAQVAIKLVDPAIAESLEILERFEREALAAAELRSTHIVQTLDYGVDDACPFIVMELLEGESLSSRLDRQGRLDLEQTSTILTQVARALSRAHDKGIVHRDLKPDNIFIVREGDDEIVKVLDFGIAKKLDPLSLTGSTKTRTGALLGTPYYMSPEQALGRKDVDHRTDIWSFGVIAYECLTGIRPFDSESVGALLMSICHEPIPKPSQVAAVSPEFDTWFAKAAARAPADRFQRASDAAAELRAIAQGKTISTSNILTSQATSNVTRIGREESVALLETIGTTAVTIASHNKRTAGRSRALLPLAGIGIVALASTLAWYHLGSHASANAAAPIASNPVIQREPTRVTSNSPLTPAVGSPTMDAHTALAVPTGDVARPPVARREAPTPTQAPTKTVRRANRRTHENPAGF
jgi:serine/threonine-protein kinase